MRFVPRSLTSPLILAALASLPVAGCTADADDEALASVEQEKRVNPGGTERYTTGRAIVKVPTGAPALAPTTLEFHPNGHTAAVRQANLDTPVTLPIGKWDVRVSGAGTASYGTIDVLGGQTTTLTLPVLAPVPLTSTAKPASASPLKFTYGPEYRPVYPEPSRALPMLSSPGRTDWAAYANPIGASLGILLVPGVEYEVRRQALSLAKLPVSATPQVYTLGAVEDDWVARKMDVATTEIRVAIDASDFPLASEPSISWRCGPTSDAAMNFAASAENGSARLRLGGIPSAPGAEVGLAGTPGCKYVLNLASGAKEIDTSLPKVDLAVHYLDVAHVHVTHEDGSSRDVAGKVRLSRIPGPGQPPQALTSFSFDTGRALPVGPGTYFVQVLYTDNAGQKTYSEQVVVP